MSRAPRYKVPKGNMFDNYAHLHSKMKAVKRRVIKLIPEEKKEEFISEMAKKERYFFLKMVGWPD